ncbi:hypothetical protein A2865_02290 [Candidatus Woesebacteria bacterium RIFCSPHIGHO2_01_FULL_39_17]|uniref:Prepilin-type N-terminal cleavage/methylation domain-containing protein n=2 Tax=Candidatus Woeseibacteriota TaxID=1752722 RepID=A0A0G0PX15_9BACT|nr:MAG: hypothetical protein US72_C0009G0023 [Microgenomates group bacterium GW2011_GWC1_38_12]KKQ93911.1 MAG: hypothetical protein UT19_C0006G0039 [Candidatus Woesebacteria bacterium GW2011_GWB1_39_10b]OGM23472.1 MAG: hypothetical protein A2865_02290 [Candidatus Woesebacteria bacterium RIFCSPHIGHO2_01_FULL_39_17]OGM64261.1 MAG: hypothetical protein A3A52_03115 [Candidatus Woesebacteria bacterium RIFCSPLOWO2_01_FULL_39_14]
MKKNRNLPQYGFTLIEVLVSAAILVILAAGFLGLQFIISQNQVTAWRNYLAIEAANLSLSNISRELRDARQSGTGGYPLEVSNDQEIVFYSDIDYDAEVERVRYTLSGTELIKGTTEPVGEPATYPADSEKTKILTDIIRNGASPVFYYYNTDWPEDTTNNPLPLDLRISDTRHIKIILITNPKADSPDFDFILESDVRLRMLN